MNVLIFLPLLLAQTLAVGRNIPWGSLPFQLGRLLWLAATALLVVLAVLRRLPRREQWGAWLHHRGALGTWAVLNFAYLGMSTVRFAPMGYEFPWFALIGAGLALAVLFLPGSARRPELLVGAAFGLNLVVLIGSILHFPVNPLRSDMLPVIQKGLDLWSAGSSPYSLFEMAGRTNRMGYLPGTLFMNWPAWALGLDLRWNTVLYRSAWMLLVWIRLRKTQSFGTSAAGALVWLALSPYMNFRHELYFEGFILGLVLLVLYPAAWVFLLPALVISRQWAWVMTPFWALTLVSNSWRTNLRRVLLLGGASLALVGGLVALLYSSTSFGEVWKVIFWFQGAVQSTEYPGDYGLTFSPVFYALGISGWQQRVQGLIVLVFLVLAFRDRANSRRVLAWSASAWAFFLLLNGHYWLYFWNSLLVYLAVLELDAQAPEITRVTQATS